MTSLATQKDEIQSTAQVIPFQYNTAEVRVVTDDLGETWFVAADLCAVLQHSNSRKALERLDADEKGVTTVYTLGGNQEMAVVNESGMYHLIMTSRKPEAQPFRKWVTSEVIPSIRKTGQYAHELATITPEQQNALQQIVARKSADDGRKRAGLWSRFNNHFKLGSYKQLPASKFPEAVIYLDGIAEDATISALLPVAQRMLTIIEGGQIQSMTALAPRACVVDPESDVSLRTFFGEYLPLDKLSCLIRMATDRLELAAQRSIQKRLK